MAALLSRVFDPAGNIGATWCSLMHDAPMWPIHGHYECRVCGRQYPVAWGGPESASGQQVRQSPVASLRTAMLPAILLFALIAAFSQRGAAEELVTAPSPAAALALARFTANQAEANRWPVETIDIEASLPKLKKSGALHALRRLPPAGHADYQVLDINGDSTVQHQVMVRYLSADERSTELPAASVAITPANYRFHYIGAAQGESGTLYLFRISPRGKREGLMKGVLWLDAETGIAVRQTGYLVKSPSIFLKRINITRENHFHDGIVEARVTHVSIDTRLVGRADLVILERPFAETVSSAQSVVSGQ